MPDEDIFETSSEQGRQAFRDGVAKEDCPLPPISGRAYFGWINGWSEEFGKTSTAKRRETASRRKAKKLRETAHAH